MEFHLILSVQNGAARSHFCDCMGASATSPVLCPLQGPALPFVGTLNQKEKAAGRIVSADRLELLPSYRGCPFTVSSLICCSSNCFTPSGSGA